MIRFERAIAGFRLSRWARATALAAACAVVSPAVAETLTVHVDQATLAAVPERAATVVVGNPMIADVSLQSGGVLVVTGKSYGTTNLLALDRTGAVLLDRSIEVKETRDATVYLYKGVARETYNCTPNCERRINLGDDPGYFSANLGQSAARNSMAAAGAAAPPGPVRLPR